MANILIDGQEYLEPLCSHQLQQFSVFLAGPAHLLNCAHIMARQSAPKTTGRALIKQNAHGPPASGWRAATQRRPVRGSPWENPPGTRSAARRLPDSRA